MSSWGFADFVFGWDYDFFADGSKARRAGFHEYVETEQMFYRLFEELRKATRHPVGRYGMLRAMAGQGAGRVLGVNLRARRDEQGISLSELARRSGIAKGTLSQLESGAGNPTIETVFSLSNALGVPVSALLSEPPASDLVLVRSADVEVLSGAAVDLRMLRRLESPGSLFEMYDQRIRPGEVQHSSGHPGTEHHVILTGRCADHRAGPECRSSGRGTIWRSGRTGRTSTRRWTGGALGAAAGVPAGPRHSDSRLDPPAELQVAVRSAGHG